MIVKDQRDTEKPLEAITSPDGSITVGLCACGAAPLRAR